MTKARFLEQQPSVKVSEIKDKYYIFICINEEKKKRDEQNGDSVVYDYVYDYTEIVVNKDEIDIDDLKINPDRYINYNEIAILNDLKTEKINKENLQTTLNNQKKDMAIVEEDVDTYIVIFKDSQREYEVTKKRRCRRTNNKNNR